MGDPVSFPRLDDDRVQALGAGRVLVWDGVLGPEASAAAVEALQGRVAAGGLRPAGVGRGGARGLHPAVRGDAIAWLEPGPGPLAPLWALFEGLRAEANAEAWLGLRGFEVQLACHPAGGPGYRAHLDAFKGDRSRVLTAIWYANPGWRPAHGGQLLAWTPEGEVSVLDPVLDRLVVFLSERVRHEVTPTAADRLAVTAWFRAAERLPSG